MSEMSGMSGMSEGSPLSTFPFSVLSVPDVASDQRRSVRGHGWNRTGQVRAEEGEAERADQGILNRIPQERRERERTMLPREWILRLSHGSFPTWRKDEGWKGRMEGGRDGEERRGGGEEFLFKHGNLSHEAFLPQVHPGIGGRSNA